MATPIGNFRDLSPRAREVLTEVPLVAAEDTRVAKRLFRLIGVSLPRLVSVRGANEREGAAKLAEKIREAGSAAYVSDAGTPGISDPGSVLARLMHREGIRVVPVPGPCSAAVAAGVSGLCANGFVFVGFLPRKGAQRKRALAAVTSRGLPTVLFESPKRIGETVGNLSEHCGSGTLACLCRELTKEHEQILQAPLGRISRKLDSGDIPEKGEFVLVVSPAPVKGGEVALDDAQRLNAELCKELPPSTAAALAARHYRVSKSSLYDPAAKRRQADR